MKKIICIAVLVMTLGFFSACSKVSDEDLLSAREAVKKGAIIVDVRTAEEFKEKHIPGAINIPVDVIVSKGINNISKDKVLVLYCRSGSRSSMSARVLREQGWVVHDVATQGEWEREIKAK